MADAQVCREARVRLRRELRRRLTSRAARRRRRVQCVVSALSWPLLLAAAVWIIVQLGFRPVRINRPLDDRPWWLVLIRDDALRHLTAAELTLSRRGMGHDRDLLLARITPRIDAAEKAGAPLVYTEWLRLRACLWTRDPARRDSRRLPPEALHHLAALRRLQPEQPAWEFLSGAAAAAEGRVDQGIRTMGTAVARPEPFCAPVLPEPWRWFAQPVIADPMHELGLVFTACRVISDEVVAAAREGDGQRANELLALLSRMACKFSEGEWLPLGAEQPAKDVSLGWLAALSTPLLAKHGALRDLRPSDPDRWAAVTRLNMWQFRVESHVSSASLGAVSHGWGLPPVFYWRRAAIALLMITGLVTAYPLACAARRHPRRPGPRALDLALAGHPVTDAILLLVAVGGGVTTGVLWNRAHWLLIDVPFWACYDCWLVSVDFIPGRSRVVSALVTALAAGPVAIALLYLVREAWGRWRLGRLARRAGSGIWDRPVRAPRVGWAVGCGALPRIMLASAVLAVFLTAGWQQNRTAYHQLDLLLWPTASAEMLTEDELAHMGAADVIASVVSARDLDEAIRRTPSIVTREVAGYLSYDRKDPAEAAFWEKVRDAWDADD